MLYPLSVKIKLSPSEPFAYISYSSLKRCRVSGHQVKNKAPAAVQITAEQLLREAHEFKEELVTAPLQKIESAEELAEYRFVIVRSVLILSCIMFPSRKIKVFAYFSSFPPRRLRKRKEFEDILRRQRNMIACWVKYALWEASQKDFERARSVFERALDVDPRNEGLWMKYAEVEMKNRFVNHARNIFDRAVAILPRVDHIW